VELLTNVESDHATFEPRIAEEVTVVPTFLSVRVIFKSLLEFMAGSKIAVNVAVPVYG